MHRLEMPTAQKNSSSPFLAPIKRADTSGEAPAPRTVSTFEVLTPRGSLHCKLTEPLAGRPDVAGVDGFLILIHAAPFDFSSSPPLPGLSTALSVGTVRVDLTGCGKSSGEPVGDSVDRDAEDIGYVIEHVRHMRSVARLRERAKGAVRPAGGDAPRDVLGLVGVGGGGTAAGRYAAGGGSFYRKFTLNLKWR